MKFVFFIFMLFLDGIVIICWFWVYNMCIIILISRIFYKNLFLFLVFFICLFVCFIILCESKGGYLFFIKCLINVRICFCVFLSDLLLLMIKLVFFVFLLIFIWFLIFFNVFFFVRLFCFIRCFNFVLGVV